MNIHIQGEFAYITARGGVLLPCEGGYRIENAIVPESGDYNAFYANTFRDVVALRRQAHRQLEQMNDFGDFKITILDGEVPESIDHSICHHWVSHNSNASQGCLQRVHPDPLDYWQWYESAVRGYSDFSESWWLREQESHGIFIAQFKPVWYFKGNSVIGRLYRYDTYSFTRLFSIVVDERERGKGYGREIIMNETAISKGPTLIRAGMTLAPFYSTAGFNVEYAMAQIAEQALNRTPSAPVSFNDRRKKNEYLP